MQVKHIFDSHSTDFERKINEVLSNLEEQKKTITEIKYLFTDRYFTALIVYK